MSDQIDKTTFQHLVRLAALEMDEERAEYLRGELNKQLKSIQELEAIQLDEDMQVTSHGVAYSPEISPSIRQDEWQPYQNTSGILGQAPQVDEDYIVVPDIPHKTLE